MIVSVLETEPFESQSQLWDRDWGSENSVSVLRPKLRLGNSWRWMLDAETENLTVISDLCEA